MKSLRSHRHRAVAAIITASRREVGMTQDQLSQVLGWHRSRLARIECGERRIDVPEFIYLATALKIDPTQLLARVLLW